MKGCSSRIRTILSLEDSTLSNWRREMKKEVFCAHPFL
jgi:hypothetical protein